MAMGGGREEEEQKEEEREVLYWGYLQSPFAEKKKRSGLRRRRVGLKLGIITSKILIYHFSAENHLTFYFCKIRP